MKKSLEDHLGDIIQKARQGLGISAEFLIQNLDLTAAQLSALEAYQWILIRSNRSDSLISRAGPT